MYRILLFVAVALAVVSASRLDAQAPPKVFLNKSPRVVAYQLKRLPNSRLLQVERNTTDVKYAPVYRAILTRAGMSPDEQSKAALALSKLNNTSFVQEILVALEGMQAETRQDQFTATQLTTQLLRDKSLASETTSLLRAVRSEHLLAQRAGFAGLFTLGKVSRAMDAADTKQRVRAWLGAVALVADPDLRNPLRAPAMALLTSDDDAIRRDAIRCLKSITFQQDETYQTLARLLDDEAVRDVVVETLLVIDANDRDLVTSAKAVDQLVKRAESTPAADRTGVAFNNAMQLADRLLADLPLASAKKYRSRLRETTVRVVQIHTVEEEMRYDTPYFAVEAGRPVQVVLKNEDIMGHNLVITTPGSLQEVADLGLAIGPTGDSQGRQYVPNSDKVLFATNLVGTGQEERLTFNAPTEVGEYPYVCTFPRHWMRMYGVMLVVEDLDAWLQDPVAPADPLGIKRSFVKNWDIQDFAPDENASALQAELASASIEKGAAHFVEATCAQCHQADGQGGKVGPALNGVLERWKGNHADVLREILEPSHRIDPKYAVHLIITVDGLSLSGIVSAEDKKSVSLLANPESTELTVISKDDIEEMIKTSTSMMPKGLLDRYSREEVIELLAYVTSLP